jgi:SagB-type dehydrogenase family enzyme
MNSVIHNKKAEKVSQENKIKIRRSISLVSFWEGNEFVVENFLTNKQTTISALIAYILQKIDTYLSKYAVLDLFKNVPATNEVVSRLIQQDILVVEGSLLDRKECLINKIWKWKNDARYFHYSTQNVIFEQDLECMKTTLAKQAQTIPPPKPFKDYSQSGIKLLNSFENYEGDFWNVLRSRRTRRLFRRQKISLQDFSTLLLWTWGKTHTLSHPELGQYILRTSPSGGSRHPIEVYPVVLNVEGISPGIYHYSVRRHDLEQLRLEKNLEEIVVRLCANQEWVRNAAAVFFMTALVERSMWKYKQSHAYRIMLLDAGHLGQTFHLVCTKLKLAPFTFAATNDKEIEKELCIDGVSEIPVYVASTGVPAKQTRQQ